MATKSEIATSRNISRNKILNDIWIRLPELENMPIGDTGYLDKLEPDVMSAPAMKGIDSQGRKFLAFRIRLTNSHEQESLGTIVCFERYPEDRMTRKDGYRLWVTAEYRVYVRESLFNDRSCGSIQTFPIFMLLDGEEIEVPAHLHMNKFTIRLDG